MATPSTARSIEKRQPPPTPQDQAESDQEGHPARVKTKGAAEEPKYGWELE